MIGFIPKIDAECQLKFNLPHLFQWISMTFSFFLLVRFMFVAMKAAPMPQKMRSVAEAYGNQDVFL